MLQTPNFKFSFKVAQAFFKELSKQRVAPNFKLKTMTQSYNLVSLFVTCFFNNFPRSQVNYNGKFPHKQIKQDVLGFSIFPWLCKKNFIIRLVRSIVLQLERFGFLPTGQMVKKNSITPLFFFTIFLVHSVGVLPFQPCFIC